MFTTTTLRTLRSGQETDAEPAVHLRPGAHTGVRANGKPGPAVLAVVDVVDEVEAARFRVLADELERAERDVRGVRPVLEGEPYLAPERVENLRQALRKAALDARHPAVRHQRAHRLERQAAAHRIGLDRRQVPVRRQAGEEV